MSKPAVWMGRSKESVSDFPDEARRQAGFQVFRVQEGLFPTDWKPMKSAGSGVFEIRLHRPHEHRVLYVTKFPEAVYVLHAFEKKSQKTPPRDLTIAQENYKAMLDYRKRSRP